MASPARILRISNPQHPAYIAYNVLAGNPDYLAQTRAINPAFPGSAGRAAVLIGSRPETHQQGYPGGAARQVGDAIPTHTGARRSSISSIATVHGELGHHAAVGTRVLDGVPRQPRLADRGLRRLGVHALDRKRSLRSLRRGDARAALDRRFLGGSPAIDVRPLLQRQQRLEPSRSRGGLWEFAIPNTGPNPRHSVNRPAAPGLCARLGCHRCESPRPRTSIRRRFYTFRQVVPGQRVERPGAVRRVDHLRPARQARSHGRLPVRAGVDSSSAEYLPASAFRPVRPGTVAGRRLLCSSPVSSKTPSISRTSALISTPKASARLAPNRRCLSLRELRRGLYLERDPQQRYLVPDPIVLDPEVVTTKRARSALGLARTSVCASMQRSSIREWDGMRVQRRIDDPKQPGTSSAAGYSSRATASRQLPGLEVELFLFTRRALGARFLARPPSISITSTSAIHRSTARGCNPASLCNTRQERSFALGLRYRLPLARGGECAVRRQLRLDGRVSARGRERPPDQKSRRQQLGLSRLTAC